MRLVRICISVTGLAVGSLVMGVGVDAASPCAPGQPTGRPPGIPPNQPGQPATRPPQYPPGKCQLQLSAASAAAGRSVSAAGSGYQPGTTVAMRLGAVAVGTAVADDQGRFSRDFTVPTDTAPGRSQVAATGTGSGGSAYEQTAALEVLPAQGIAPMIVGGSTAPAGRSLRSGAGLAAAPRGGANGSFSNPLRGATGGVVAPTPGGGLIALPGITSTGQGSTIGNSASGSVVFEQASGETTTSGSGSGGFNPLIGVAGGLALATVGGAAAVAAKRRKPSQP